MYPVFCDIDFFCIIYLDMIQIKFDFWRIKLMVHELFFFFSFPDFYIYDIDIQ